MKLFYAEAKINIFMSGAEDEICPYKIQHLHECGKFEYGSFNFFVVFGNEISHISKKL